MSLEHSPERLAYSIRDFCALTGMGRTWVYGEIKAGRLLVKKAGARTLIPVDAARTFLDSLPGFTPKPKEPERDASAAKTCV